MNTPIAVYGCDERGTIMFYNRAAASLWQAEPKIGEDSYEQLEKLSYPDGRVLPLNACPMARTLRLQVPHEGEELMFERPDGSLRYLKVYPYPFFGDNGEFKGAYETMVDITAHKEAASRQRIISDIVDSAEDAIIVKDLQGMVISWNAAAVKLFGYDATEMIGKHIGVIIPKDRKNEEMEIMARISKGESIRHYETIRRHKLGKRIPISLTISPVKNERGEIIGASKIAREITQEVAVRKMLELHNKELKQENQYKDQFLSLASHELKTPLTSAKAYTQLILHNTDRQQKNYRLVSKALLTLDRMEKLINGLLDISRIKSGKMPYEMTALKVKDLITGMVEEVKQLSEDHRIIICQLDDVCVMGDRVRLEQVLVNLLGNAIKYSPEGGDIEVAAKQKDGRVVISVTDHGIGIPPPSINLLFQRYYRVDGSATNFPGLGLGLFIAAEILRKHQGTYWVESTLGKGSSFYFELPLMI